MESADEQHLLALRGGCELRFEHGGIVRVRRGRCTDCPAEAGVEELEANPPIHEIGILRGWAINLRQVVECGILYVEPYPARRSRKPVIHRRALLVGKDAGMRGLSLEVDDNLRPRCRLAPAKVLRQQVSGPEDLRLAAKLLDDRIRRVREVAIEHRERPRVILYGIDSFEVDMALRAGHLHVWIVDCVPGKDRHRSLCILVADLARVRRRGNQDEILPRRLGREVFLIRHGHYVAFSFKILLDRRIVVGLALLGLPRDEEDFLALHLRRCQNLLRARGNSG